VYNVPQLCAVCLYLPPLKLTINFTILQLLPTFKTTKSIWHHLAGVIHCAKCMYAFFHFTSIYCSCNQNGTFTNARWPDISTETTNIIIAMNKNFKTLITAQLYSPSTKYGIVTQFFTTFQPMWKRAPSLSKKQLLESSTPIKHFEIRSPP